MLIKRESLRSKMGLKRGHYNITPHIKCDFLSFLFSFSFHFTSSYMYMHLYCKALNLNAYLSGFLYVIILDTDLLRCNKCDR